MKVKIYENRTLSVDSTISATQLENGATTLEFEFPDIITFDGIEYNTSELNKKIEFQTSKEKYFKLIENDKYTLTSQETSERNLDMQIVLFKIIKEAGEPIEEKVWATRIYNLRFNDRINATDEKVDEEKVEVIDVLIDEVNNLKSEYIELIENGVPGGGGEGKPTSITSTNLDVGGSDYFRTINIKEQDITSIKKVPTLENNLNVHASDDVKHISNTERAKWNSKSEFSGNYNDLSNKPVIPPTPVNSDWNAVSGLAQILNKPVIPTKTSQLTNDSNLVADTNYVHTENNYTTTEKDKLATIETNANNYAHPVNHNPSIILQDINNRFVSDTEKDTWNNKLSIVPSASDTTIGGLKVRFDEPTKTLFITNNGTNP